MARGVDAGGGVGAGYVVEEGYRKGEVVPLGGRLGGGAWGRRRESGGKESRDGKGETHCGDCSVMLLVW